MCVQAIAKSGAGSYGFTGRHGTFTIRALAPGRYKVQFTSCGGDFVFLGQTGLNYAGQWYKNKPSQRSADVVTVRAAKTTTGIDAGLARGGSVSGQVTYRPNGRPVSFVCVYAFTDTSTVANFGLTDRRGHYLVDGLSTGRYDVEYSPCSGESALAGEGRGNLHVVAGQTRRGVNESLPLGGSVSGVTSALVRGHVQPAPATCVVVVPLKGSGLAALTWSARGGSYTATGVPPGRAVVLAGETGCSSDAPALSAQASSPITVAAGATTTAPSLTLATTGTITGTVRTGGHALGGICAEAYQVVSFGGSQGNATGVSSRASGGYVIGDLQPGLYKVRFTTGCGASGYATRWYNHATTQRGARVILVRAAAVTSGINATLPRG